MNIDPQTYAAIESQIHSDSSVVGIDAKKTHILIIHLLQQLNERVSRLEEKLES